MTGRIAVDTNAVVALFREEDAAPRELRETSEIVVPLPVAGELFAGAYSSMRKGENLPIVHDFLARRTVLAPDHETARRYGELRALFRFHAITPSKMVDLWI